MHVSTPWGAGWGDTGDATSNPTAWGGGRWPGSGAFSPEVPRPHRPFNLYVSLSLGLSPSWPLCVPLRLPVSLCLSLPLRPASARSPQCQKVSDVCGRDFGPTGGFSGQREEEGIYEFAQGASGQETLTPEASGCQVLGFRCSGGRRGHLPSPRGTGSPRSVWEAPGAVVNPTGEADRAASPGRGGLGEPLGRDPGSQGRLGRRGSGDPSSHRHPPAGPRLAAGRLGAQGRALVRCGALCGCLGLRAGGTGQV